MLIDYEELVQDALRTVVCRVLKQTQENGLSGPHHFYISFATNFPGVEIPDLLRETNPEEVTIVLQHQFWDLEVEDSFFTVSLSFKDVPQKIRVPFYALISFMDPGVKFGLQFTPVLPEFFSESDPKEVSVSDKNPKNTLQKEGNVITLDLFRK